jgi:TPR repeat protein
VVIHLCEVVQMDQDSDQFKNDKLYLKALRIQEGKAGGLWMPIMWHLALRGHTDAMIELASWFSGSGYLKDLGSAADKFSAAGLYRNAYRAGNPRAAQHMAMICFNRNDLSGYRLWLRRAVQQGDDAAELQLRCFETRLWHSTARKIGRLRPQQKRDEFA